MLFLSPVAAVHQTPFHLNGLFSDGMVLQRGISDQIFGSGEPGSFVQVTLTGPNGSQQAGATIGSDGTWHTSLKPLDNPGPYVMSATCGSLTIQVNDILAGEVWIASGQSNMEFPESSADDKIEAQGAGSDQVRMFTVKHQTADSPAHDVTGRWGYSSTLDILKMSAVALAFAREVNQKLNVPVGIISSCWGGTPVEAWTSREALDRDDRLQPMVTKYLDDLQQYPARKAAYDEAVQQWTHGKQGGENQGFINGWALPQYNDADWKTVQGGLDVNTTEGREVDGAFWYRATVNFPDEWYGKPLKLSLGALGAYDTTYVNDVRVGFTDQKARDASSLLRVYPVAPGIVRRGANTIAVRVFNPGGQGGMLGPAEEMKIGLADTSSSMPLSGDWKFKIEQELDPNTPRPALPIGPGNPRSPTELFSGMIAPLVPYGIRGAIWYQGEQNVGQPDSYAELFPDMIRDWRTRWGEGSFPFYFVQLPNFHDPVTDPGDSDWARLREAQATVLGMASTGMAVTIDLGEAKTIHPAHKREVGRRLALWALGKSYHQPVYYGSPMYQSMVVSGSDVRVTFSNGSLTTSDGVAPVGFELAGDDHKFYWATAKVDGSIVILSAPQVPKPIAVRYAWADNPPTNLTNHEGLPAAPFRTDTWTKNP